MAETPMNPHPARAQPVDDRALLDSMHRAVEEFRAAADQSLEAIKTTRNAIALLNKWAKD
jgi:hypothetical protein